MRERENEEGEGAHIDAKPVMDNLQQLLIEQLEELKQIEVTDLVEQRYQRLRSFDSTLSLNIVES